MTYALKGYRASSSDLIVSQSTTGYPSQGAAVLSATNLLRSSEELVYFEIVDESTGSTVEEVRRPPLRNDRRQ
jgi:hypothetical protein